MSHGRKNTVAVLPMGGLIGKLNRVTWDKSAAERPAIREKWATPVLDKIKLWQDGNATWMLPKCPLGSAIAYALELWPKLIACLEDGHIEIDNSKAGNAIRPLVESGKGWLFSGGPTSVHASAMLYTLVESTKANPGLV